MKKRVIALLLTLALVVSLCPVAFAAVDPNYSVKLIGTEGTVGTNDTPFLDLKLQLKGTTIANEAATVGVNIKVDTTKLMIVRYVNGNATTVGTTGYGSVSNGIGNLDASVNGYVTGAALMGRLDSANNALYLGLQATFGESVTDWADDYGDVAAIRLAFVNGATIDDLDMSSIQVQTVDEAYAVGQNQVAVIPAGSNDYQYGITARGTGDENLAKPIIEYPNSDVINLNSVKLDAVNKYVNVPVSLPTAGNDVTVATTAMGYYTSNMQDGTEITSGVTYTYGLQIKDGETVHDLTADEAAVISVGTDGVVTVKAGAPEAVVVITATGSYKNTKGNTSTASGTFELNLRHGDAGDKNTENPSDPPKDIGGDPDAPKTANGVAIYKGETQVTNSLAGTAHHQEAIAIPASGNATVAFTGKVLDQFGDEMTGEIGTWNDAELAGKNGVTFSNGTVTVVPGADKDVYNYTYGSGTYSATAEITVDDNAINWPTLENDTIVYGQPVSDLKINDDGSVSDGSANPPEATFAWTDGTVILNADETDTQDVQMTCTFGSETATKNYAIKVKKANQVITLPQDGDTPALSIDIERGIATTLAATVANETVPTAGGTSAAVYSLTTNNGFATLTGNSIKGVQLTNSATNDHETLRIVAAGNENYNEAAREVNVYVTKQFLRATIVFDTTAPKFGQEITATITAAADQPNSITTDVDYTWGQIITDGENTRFEPITTGNSEGKLTNASNDVATVKYTPVAGDIGKILALKVTTPTDVTGYDYAHSVQTSMDNAVGKASQAVGTWTATTTTTTIKADTVDGAEYAISEHVAVAMLAEVAGGARDGDTLTWQDSSEFTGLTPNKEYDVHVRLKATETHEESAEDVKTFKTDALSILDPNEPDPDNPKNAAVTLSGTEKFGETLTATPRDPEDKAGALTTDTVYVWERTTVPTDDSEPVTTVIDGAESNTYTLVEDDIGCIITVKASPAPTSEYAGTVKASTGVIAKADGPVLATDGFDTTEVSNATATDGTITIAAPADLTANYEYRLKAAEGAEENAWTDATIADGKLADGLGVGTYEVRIKETATTNASNIIELEVNSAGYNISGEVTSYNAKNAVTYKLYRLGEDGQYETTAAYEGTAIEAAETTTGAATAQQFTIEGIADGTYKLEIIKTVHITITVEGIVVNGADVDLTSESYPAAVRSMTMSVGDIDGNGAVNVSDANIIARPANYNNQDVSTAEHPHADLDGNGAINISDKNILARPENYNKTADDFIFTV